MDRPSAAPRTAVALTDDRATDPRVTGRKAAMLAQLLKSGFPCAGGMVIPAWIHHHRQGRAKTGSDDGASLADLQRALDEITDVYRTDLLAVRSSSTAEDMAEASYAGLYTSALDVGGAEALRAAVLKCWASAGHAALSQYKTFTELPPMAVLVQRMLEPDAAGAAFVTNPEGGATTAVSVSAVRGRGDRLMQGETTADEWTVTISAATCVRKPYDAITSDQAVAIADLTRQVSARLSCRAEIEWALLDGRITLLQARPTTAVDKHAVAWPTPTRGEWRRDIRLGEWLPEPVTPLFATWFLPTVDLRFRRAQWQHSGVLVPKPSYRLVHGWYYHSPLGERRSAALLEGMLTHPVFASAMLAGRRWPSITNRIVISKETAALENNTLSRRALLGSVATGFNGMSEQSVVSFINRAIELVGDYLWPMFLVGGSAWRAEQALARYYRKTLLPDLEEPYYGLLVDRTQAKHVARHSVSTLDWYRPTLGEVSDDFRPEPRSLADNDDADRLKELCLSVLARHKTAPQSFNRLLALARGTARLRQRHTDNLTEPWPILRQALHRLGTVLTEKGVLDHAEHVHFLTYQELSAALAQRSPADRQEQIAHRTSAWAQQRTLRPPLSLGTAACLLPLLLGRPLVEADGRTSDDVLEGIGVSPGVATGRARLVDHPAHAEVAAGDVLVVRSLVPALAPLIARAGAVAADMGSVAAHMSVIAREYGVPAVVALHSVTQAVRDGDVITVDGTTGRVHRRGPLL
ncbi:PEP-utilizing enzyme [Streptomyces sp. NBC_00988]|uniref:PEP/pyruvate-binding domain-containing protein n=1 Tax=Streptomyces sp. NBC_00988 TaxID=2903704 RepID=UPI003865E70C|nr:PEP-utilizing enzyme [Streptomyces sp. NBC_00988]